MTKIDILGIFAGVLTTVSFVPQAVRTWRTRRTDDISLMMLLMFCLGVGLWIIYGVLLGSLPVIAANVATLCFVLFILGIKLANLKGRA